MKILKNPHSGQMLQYQLVIRTHYCTATNVRELLAPLQPFN